MVLWKKSLGEATHTPFFDLRNLRDENGKKVSSLNWEYFILRSQKSASRLLVLSLEPTQNDTSTITCREINSDVSWVWAVTQSPSPTELRQALERLSETIASAITIIPTGSLVSTCRSLCEQSGSHFFEGPNRGALHFALEVFDKESVDPYGPETPKEIPVLTTLTHLDRLEAESIEIIREVVADARNPVMLYSIGKDSSVMLHLARKAFYPSLPPFPLLHVDTRWKFRAMYEFREQIAASGLKLITHVNPEGVAQNINPFQHGSAVHTDIMKTQGLKQALDKYDFDAAFGGARRDEEKSRAKERIFSFRNKEHHWDPKNQRPELWNLYNGLKNEGESIRVFPLSNWTELDIWQYIYREQIELVPLYFAAMRPVVRRDGILMLVDDERLNVLEHEVIEYKKIRFRTLGCYPLTGAIESDASDISSVILEIMDSQMSERQGRTIDKDSFGSMERKKQEGYF